MVLLGHKIRNTTIAVALSATAFVVLEPDAAVAAPAQSTKVLPPMSALSSAVDNAGGSLAVGVRNQSSATAGLYAYHRDPAGHWAAGQRVPIGDLTPGGILDSKVTAGADGFYVITWLYSDDDQTGTVFSATRLSSGSFTGPRKLFDTLSTEPLVMAGNRNGDAAVTQTSALGAARYVRGVGWTPLDTMRSADPSESDREGARISMSAARTVDITFQIPVAGRAHVQQLTRTTTADEFDRRNVYTAADDTNPYFDIAMDASGLQTLVVRDADDAIKVYREDLRRGPFVYRWRKAIDPNSDSEVNQPQVDSAGSYTRVAWHTGSPDSPQPSARVRAVGDTSWTRAFNGTAWGPSSSTLDRYGSMGRITGFGIGTDGRGVEIGRQRLDEEFNVLTRGLLERNSRADATVSTTLTGDDPALAVGPTSVSQVSWTETPDETDDTRTVVLVRR